MHWVGVIEGEYADIVLVSQVASHPLNPKAVGHLDQESTRSFSEFHYNKRKEVAYTIVLSYMYTPVAVEDDAIWETTFCVL